jgi:hypothetical protein
MGLSFSEQHQFAHIVSMISDIKDTEECAKNDCEMIPRLPTTYNDIRTWYVRGPTSIANNLPHPNVTWVNDHSYASVKQCIAHHLANGLSIMDICDNEKYIITYMGESKRATTMKKRAIQVNSHHMEDTLPILLIRWSDDWEPNNTKSNRGSVWILTITILSNPSDSGKLPYTYPISLGHKSGSHEDVESLLFSEIKDLSSGRDNLFFFQKDQKLC